MFTRHLSVLCMAAIVAVMATVGQVDAVPTQVLNFDDPNQCDPLFIPMQVDEIGDFTVFPAGEELEAVPLSQGPAVCPPFDDPSVLDLVVEIRNLTTKTFEEVWYVANKETDISNYDGFANDAAFPGGHEAFRIDRLLSDPGGMHHPLIAEIGATQDGKWEPGEVWQFVLQDYFNALGFSHAAIDSIGVGDASTAFGIVHSSGSIIAIVPEPTTCMLMMVGLAGMLIRPLKRALTGPASFSRPRPRRSETRCESPGILLRAQPSGLANVPTFYPPKRAELMKSKLGHFVLATTTCVLTATAAMAVPVPGIFNTGVNNLSNPLPSNAVDPHWVLSTGPVGTPTAITGDPIPGSWVPNTTTSRWVTPVINGLTNVPGGNYSYDLTFNLTGFIPSTATVSGMWASDNQSSMLLNGVPFATHSGGGTAFTFFDSFGTGVGFLPGINTLTVLVTNISGPSGAHVTDLIGDAQLIPEPCTIALGVLALCGVVLRRRKNLSARQ